MKLSSASKRAENYPHGESNWYCGFQYTAVSGLGYEEGVHRRDPSSVIEHDGKYYVWYTKSSGVYYGNYTNYDMYAKKYPWDYADIYYACSEDGINWKEKGCAVHRGGKGEYDERTVCTPDILEHDGKYYLVYQAIAQGDYDVLGESVAMAIADDINGPWKKISSSILERMDSGTWFPESKGNYNEDEFVGVVHDPSLYYFNDKFYLYYKCTNNFRKYMKYAGPDTRWGVAIADKITGPYVHSEYNPITNSGHETMLWHYDGGMAALLNRDGPEKDTIQYAKDGVNFELMSHVQNTPQAGGAFRGKDLDRCPLEGIRWGMCHVDERGTQWCYIMRFDLDTRLAYCQGLAYPKINSESII